MRIVSRKSEDDVQHERLRGVVEMATDGGVTPSHEFPKLVSQVEDSMLRYMVALEKLQHAFANLQQEAAALSTMCAMQESKLEDLMHIGFDEALDYATLDLMEAFLGSGAANTTYDGALAFEPDVTFTRQDLKPLLRQAIITWVNTKAT